MQETELIVARMQNRRGRRADLPQPLMPGELGFCTDTGQLFIGASENTNMTPGIETFTNNIATNSLANEIGGKNIVQISRDPAITPPPVLNFVPDYQVNTLNNTFIGWNLATDAISPANLNNPASSSYLGVGYTARWFIDTSLTPENQFVKGEVIMPTYLKEDAAAVASIMNSIQFWSVTDGATPPQDPYTFNGASGIVTTKENIEIYTEYSPGRGLPIKRILAPALDWESVTGIDFTYSDALTVDYSIQSDQYSRTGNIKIICSPDNGTDPVVGTLFDASTELFNQSSDPAVTSGITVDFKLAPLAGPNPPTNATALYYRTSGIVSQLTLTTSTKIWQSF